MPTIKELAVEAGLSPSTVSIVLQGKSEQRNIPEGTQKRVWDAAKKLGYHPNVAARRLRVQQSENFIITVFWASDFRANMMVRFLRGLQEAALNTEKNCEILIHPYNNNELYKSIQALNMCNAAIICNASKEDIVFLEEYKSPVPIVLYNRHSDKFCTVNVDDRMLGTMAAEVFLSRGHKKAAILNSEYVYPGMDTRIESFIHTCDQGGMSILTVDQDNSMHGGYVGAQKILSSAKEPDCLFCASDYMAIGALKAFGEAGVKIPEQMEIISIGNGDKEMEEFASVSLSVIILPMEKMAESCLELTLNLLEAKVEPPHSVELPLRYQSRESCGVPKA